VPLVDTEDKAEQYAQLMCILQQHHHPLLCRSYMVPCFLTSAKTGQVQWPHLRALSAPLRLIASSFMERSAAHASPHHRSRVAVC
jgi:hypothetical protein